MAIPIKQMSYMRVCMYHLPVFLIALGMCVIK